MTTAEHQFIEGDICWLRDGRIVRYVSDFTTGITRKTQHVVELGYAGSEDPDDNGTYFYDRLVVDEVLHTAPMAWVDAEIETKKRQLEEANVKLREAKESLRQVDVDMKRSLKDLERYQGIDVLADLMAGKVTHAAFQKDGVYLVSEWADYLRHNGSDYYLVIKPQPTYARGVWEARTERYGHHNVTKFMPCRSEEEAQAKLREWALGDLQKWWAGKLSRQDPAEPKHMAAWEIGDMRKPLTIAQALIAEPTELMIQYADWFARYDAAIEAKKIQAKRDQLAKLQAEVGGVIDMGEDRS